LPGNDPPGQTGRFIQVVHFDGLSLFIADNDSEPGKPVILQHLGYIELPPHARKGGFDHAAYRRADDRLYVAHTANDAVDVIDCAADRYLHSISGLTGVAGVLTAQERDLVFTSNRAEDTVGIFASDDHNHLAKVPVGHRPNGLAYDSLRHVLLVANVGDPAIPGSASAQSSMSKRDLSSRA
jgi:DNA-binding beta-propeller fold protein YncE